MDVCMNTPHLNSDPVDLKKSRPYAEATMIGLAAVGIGILVGIWVVGPALTGTGTVASDWTATRSIPMSYNDMIARPDPLPYRTATLAFDNGSRVDYAIAAKARAKSEYGRVAVSDETPWNEQTTGRASSRSYAPDRHSGIH